MASAMSTMDWQQQPATSPRQDEPPSPPPFQWWPPTPGSTAEEALLSPQPIISPSFSPFAAFANNPSMFDSSPFLQPFMPTPVGRKHQTCQNYNQHYPALPQLSPFAMSPFASAQPSPGLFSPPPSNARSSPSPCSSARDSPQSSFLQPRGVLKRQSFLKLPPEVRAAIYQELVPERDLHVTMDPINGKMFSYPCQQMGDAEYVGRNWFAMSEPEYRKLGSTPRTCGHLACVRIGPRTRGLGRDERGWAGLVATCKAIHDEFSPYVYARPRLLFDDVATLRRFLETADSQRLRHYVRNLSIAYLVPECPAAGLHQPVLQARLDDWIRVWQGISLMEGLRHLHVTLVARAAFAHREYETRVLGPLMLLRGRKRKDGNGGKLEDFDLISFEGTRERRLPGGLEDPPFRYIWKAWSALAGPELERAARRYKQFVDAQPPYWHHLSSYRQHAFYRGDFSMRSLYSVM